MKRSDLAVGIEWLGTLGAAGFWTVTGVWRRYPNLTTVMVVPSRAHLLTGLGLICTALIARRYRTGRFFPRTRFDFPLLLFLLSALLGWLCAYNRELGLIKLIFILSALSVFYLLAGADLVFARGFACGLVLLAAFLSVLAIVQYDFADSLGQL